MQKMSTVGWVAFVLVVIGGLNWGLVGVAGFNLVDTIFGAGSTLSAIVYDLVGLSSIYLIFMAFSSNPGASMI